MDFSSLVSSLPAMAQALPLMIQGANVVFLLFFVWFFGSIAMKGHRGRKGFSLKIVGTLLTGVLCLFGGSAFAGFMPFMGDGILGILQIDMIISGFIVSVVIYFSLGLMTHEKSSLSPEEMAEKLMRKVAALEDLLKRKVHHITGKEAEEIAEKALEGYKAKKAKLVGNEYEILLKKDDKEASVILDAWDGEIKKKIAHEPVLLRILGDPKKLSGLVVLLLLIVSSAVFFEGFPNPTEDMASMFGMSAEDLQGLAESLKNSPLVNARVPEGCISPLVFSQYYSQMQNSDFALDHAYDGDAEKASIEENCGRSMGMIKVVHEGQDLVIGVTEDGKAAYLTDGIFCMCVETIMSG